MLLWLCIPTLLAFIPLQVVYLENSIFLEAIPVLVYTKVKGFASSNCYCLNRNDNMCCSNEVSCSSKRGQAGVSALILQSPLTISIPAKTLQLQDDYELGILCM